jgi:aspartyl protease family protein
MTEDMGSLIYMVVLLMLVTSSLLAHRLPIAQMARMLLSWLLIFAAVFLVFSYRVEFARVWDRVSANLSPRPSVSSDGSVHIPKSPDGHFWVTASVNGKPVRFMVDSGATVTSMSAQTAQMAGIDLNAIGFPALVQTANGTIEMRRARISTFAVETIQREDMAVLVSDALGDTNLLGMNFLSSLNGWRIEGEEMILNP